MNGIEYEHIVIPTELLEKLEGLKSYTDKNVYEQVIIAVESYIADIEEEIMLACAV